MKVRVRGLGFFPVLVPGLPRGVFSRNVLHSDDEMI